LEQKAQDLGQQLKQQLLGKEVVRQVISAFLPSMLRHTWILMHQAVARLERPYHKGQPSEAAY